MPNNIINISIIISAKNEEKNIPNLILGLDKINYPKEKFEVIILDDNSTDNTFELTKSLTSNKPNYSILKAENKIYEGKRGALDIGIIKSKFDHIMITDADCIPEENWLQEFSNKFKEGYDFLFGIAPYFQNKSFVNKISCFENLRLHILTFTTAKLGLPFSAAARSFGFLKSSFYKIKGYKNTTNTLSGDDDLLLREAVKNKLRIGTVDSNKSFVYSYTKETIISYFRQKARHTSTSNYLLMKQKLMLVIWHLSNLIFLFSPIMIFKSKLFIFPLLLKIVVDFIIVKKNQNKYGYHFNFYEIIILQIFYELFLIVHYIYGSLKKPSWN